MSDDKSKSPFQPGVYVKGEQTRRVDTASGAVQAEFDGFKRQSEEGDVASGFASVNDNDPESEFRDTDPNLNEQFAFEPKAEFADDQAEPLDADEVKSREYGFDSQP